MDTDEARFDLAGFIRMMRRLFQAQGVHLRELVQNALEAVYQAELNGFSEGRIEISSDPNKGLLRVTDNGIGMTREDLLSKLTVLFRTGWPQESEATLGIGQFGFGFYSTLLVGDEVRVVSRARGNPGQAYCLTFRPDLNKPTLTEVEELPPEGTVIELVLRKENCHYADDKLICSELRSTYLYSKYPIAVNGLSLGLPLPEGWKRRAFERGGTADARPWIQQRYQWKDPPLAVIPMRFDNGGWLAVLPDRWKTRSVEVYRRGIAVTKEDLIPYPLNQMMCGIVDMENLSLKPDRETLLRDENHARLLKELASAAREGLVQISREDAITLARIFEIHRYALLQTMDGDELLRIALGPHLPLRPYRHNSLDPERAVTLKNIISDGELLRLVWVADPDGERVLADRAFELGQHPVLLEDGHQQRLVGKICRDLKIPFVHVGSAYVEDVSEMIVYDDDLIQLFRSVAEEECEIVCSDDHDARLPVRMLRLRLEEWEGGETMGWRKLVRHRTDRKNPPSLLLIVNLRNSIVQGMKQSSGALDRLTLARVLVFLAGLSAGRSFSPEQLGTFNQQMLTVLEFGRTSRTEPLDAKTIPQWMTAISRLFPTPFSRRL
jgi:hypothetical protein